MQAKSNDARDAAELSIDCPSCGAPAGTHCTVMFDGKTLEVVCIARATAGYRVLEAQA